MGKLLAPPQWPCRCAHLAGTGRGPLGVRCWCLRLAGRTAVSAWVERLKAHHVAVGNEEGVATTSDRGHGDVPCVPVVFCGGVCFAHLWQSPVPRKKKGVVGMR